MDKRSENYAILEYLIDVVFIPVGLKCEISPGDA
ncbi:hypothetical protein Pan54_15920 [Rubinisphaera italica]|uniref:Uncharacterized protein n=1 Tax=Rubinisphaera italica TaxID=2527969 RepID=A0A5C5XDK9_9PLAN|nr:hypothetical protein Pan54_15920 [Rubinisphaera italica]